MTIEKIPVKKKKYSKFEIEQFASVGQQSLTYFRVDQLKHMGMCYVKGVPYPVRLNPQPCAYMKTNEFIQKMRIKRRARMIPLPVLNNREHMKPLPVIQ